MEKKTTQDEYGPEWRKMIYGAAIPRVAMPEPEITQEAARELLEACRRAYTLCPEGHLRDERGIWAELRAAIAKAEGK